MAADYRRALRDAHVLDEEHAVLVDSLRTVAMPPMRDLVGEREHLRPLSSIPSEIITKAARRVGAADAPAVTLARRRLRISAERALADALRREGVLGARLQRVARSGESDHAMPCFAEAGLDASASVALLRQASLRGHLRIAEPLAAASAAADRADSNGWAPLRCASREGHLEVVQRLLRADAAVGRADSNGSVDASALRIAMGPLGGGPALGCCLGRR